MVKGITYELSIGSKGEFSFSTGVNRMEKAVDFLIAFWDVRREYKDFFSTYFLRAYVQTNTNSPLTVLRPLILDRFTRLLQEEVSEITVDSTRIDFSNDRKVSMLNIAYSYTPEESPNPSPNEPLILTRFL